MAKKRNKLATDPTEPTRTSKVLNITERKPLLSDDSDVMLDVEIQTGLDSSIISLKVPRVKKAHALQIIKNSDWLDRFELSEFDPDLIYPECVEVLTRAGIYKDFSVSNYFLDKVELSIDAYKDRYGEK